MPRAIFLLAIFAVAAVVALTRNAGPGGCVPEQFPDSWLESQETAGGHTIARHVGKADQWLIDRLAKEPRIKAASSFADLETARFGIRAALTQNRVLINNWVANAGKPRRRAWTYDGRDIMGTVVERSVPQKPVAPSTDVKVVMEADGVGGCMLLTAYPTPE